MSESSLVTYRVLNSKNINYRGGKTIKYIIPHCYVGQITAKRGVDAFNSRNDASVHYVVGYEKGDIGQQVSEQYRAWTTGGDKTVRNQYGTFTGRDIDFESVTMEIACDPKAPYTITDGAYANIVNLMADIAMRNNIDLKYTGDVADVGNPTKATVLLHRMFASKACPGEDIIQKLPSIIANARKVIETGVWYGGGAPDPAPTPTPTPSKIAQPVLKKGSKGSEVVKLQQNLNEFGYNLVVDGDFGTGTDRALRGWQKATKLSVDGSYGPASYNKMKELLL